MKYYLIITSLLLAKITVAQHARFIRSGEITYEKRINTHALMKMMKEPANSNVLNFNNNIDDYIKDNQQFLTIQSILVFNENQSFYQTTENAFNPLGNIYFATLGTLTIQQNLVYQNYKTDSIISQKPIESSPFLIKASSPKIKWKLTTETRDILGYTCYRANGLALDSIYVVAFYCPQIVPSGGPESFHGLPGMVLGIALPQYHVTWFATKVVDRVVAPNEIIIPQQGILKSPQELHEYLLKSYKNHTPKMKKLHLIGAEL